jgi:hypothetical protein
VSKLLEMDIHHLASTRRFSQPARSKPMTLDAVPDEWMECFSRAESQADWDNILRITERCSPSVYFAAREACRGRDSRSKRIAAYRQQCQDFLDSM